VRGGPLLAAVRQRLLARSAALGHALSDDPELTLAAGGRTLALQRHGRYCRASGATGRVYLRSRTWMPADQGADQRDCRVLGVAVRDIAVNATPLRLDHPCLSRGWHAPEADWRWTDGNAAIDLPTAGTLTFTLARTGRYWRGAMARALAG
jgi:hypothetical protein